MKKALIALTLLSNISFADTGSLWCAFSSYGTPTETTQNGATPWAFIQLDKMSGDSVQIYLEDIYHGTTDVFTAELNKSKNTSISGVKLGSYSGKKNLELNIVKGKILLNVENRTFNCEIPGEYKKDYSNDVKSPRCGSLEGLEISSILYSDLSNNDYAVINASYVGIPNKSDYVMVFKFNNQEYKAVLNSDLSSGRIFSSDKAVAQVVNGKAVCL